MGKATEKVAIEACVLNAKGKMNAHIFVSALAECFSVDAEQELRETLRTRLERYVIADDVQIEDVTDQFSLFHVLSEESPTLEHGRIVSVRRFAEQGCDVWSDAARHDAVWQQLSSAFAFLDSTAAEVMRIEQGIPRWGRELTEQIIPIEANLEQRTIDYEKGCYIGGSDQQTVMRGSFIRRCPPPAANETCRSFASGKRSGLDHERHAQRTNRKANCARLP